MRRWPIVVGVLAVLVSALSVDSAALAQGGAAQSPTQVEADASPREQLLAAWEEGGPNVRRLAGAALIGSDEDVDEALDNGLSEAKDQDLRAEVELMVSSSGPFVADAASKALEGTSWGLARLPGVELAEPVGGRPVGIGRPGFPQRRFVRAASGR